jgi:hypothetical protein
MSVIPVDYGQSATKFVLIGTDTYGVCVLGHSFGVGVPNVVDGANAVHDSWQAMDVMAVLNSGWRLEEVVLTIMTATGPVTGTDTRSPLTGANTGGGAAPNLAYLIRKTTDQGGRAGRGRMYLPGVEETDVDAGGNFVGGILATAATVFGDMINDFSTNDVPLRLLHNNPALTPGVVTGLAFQTRAATQRRRLRR